MNTLTCWYRFPFLKYQMNILDVTYHLSEKCTKIVTKFSGPKEFKGLKGHRVIQVNWVVYIKYSGRKPLMNICIRPQLHNTHSWSV